MFGEAPARPAGGRRPRGDRITEADLHDELDRQREQKKREKFEAQLKERHETLQEILKNGDEDAKKIARDQLAKLQELPPPVPLANLRPQPTAPKMAIGVGNEKAPDP